MEKIAIIKQENGKFVLYTKDGSKVLGTHPSYEKALAQEKAIQASKHAEFAPGIPERKIHELPETEGDWQLSIQDHDADKAGKHWDLRLTDPTTGHAHSWAVPKRSWPEAGKIRLAVQQPTHTADYANWEGRIEDGYGKGDVKLIHSSPTKVKSSKDRIEFTHPDLGPIILRKKDTVNWMMIKPGQKKTAARQEKPGWCGVAVTQTVLLAEKTAGITSGGRETKEGQAELFHVLHDKEDPTNALAFYMGRDNTNNHHLVIASHKLKTPEDAPSNESMLGYISSYPVEIGSPDHREISALYVKPEYRGKGHAKLLIAAKKAFVPGATFYVAPDSFRDRALGNDKLESMYKKEGFTQFQDSKYLHWNPKQEKTSEYTEGPTSTFTHDNATYKEELIQLNAQQKIAEVPDSKPKFKLTNWDKLNPDNPHVWQAKLDGAFMYYTLDPEGIKAFSYRRSKKTGESIEHTAKIKGFDTAKVPEELHGAVLMGEAYHPDLNLGEIGGILNSRNKPISTKLVPAIHGILSLPGKDVSAMSNWEKLDTLKDIAKKIPVFELPDTAKTPADKHRLMTKIQANAHNQTSEGLMEYPEFGTPRKSPISPTDDFPITGITGGTGKFKDSGAGALLVGDNSIRVGTGLSDALRRALHQNPDLIKGLVARVSAKEQFRSGKLRTPAFKGFHPDKSDPDAYARILEALKGKEEIKEAGVTDLIRSGSTELVSTLRRLPGLSDMMLSLAVKLPLEAQIRLLNAIHILMERAGTINPGVTESVRTLLSETLLDPAIDAVKNTNAARTISNMTPGGRMANSLRQLHHEYPMMGFNKIAEVAALIRQQMEKEAFTQHLGNVAGGAAVGAGMGALAGKGAKQKLWGMLIGGGVGGYAGAGAYRTEPTFESSDPLPSYLRKD